MDQTTLQKKNEEQPGKSAERDSRAIVRIIAAGATVLLVILAVCLIVNLVSIGRLNTRRTALQSKLDGLHDQIDETEDLIDYRSTESYIERYAREQLGMIGKDEILYIGN